MLFELTSSIGSQRPVCRPWDWDEPLGCVASSSNIFAKEVDLGFRQILVLWNVSIGIVYILRTYSSQPIKGESRKRSLSNEHCWGGVQGA